MDVTMREARPDDAEAVVGTAVKHAKIGGRYVDEIIIEKFL